MCDLAGAVLLCAVPANQCKGRQYTTYMYMIQQCVGALLACVVILAGAVLLFIILLVVIRAQ
jgi:hypothetical protein